MTSLHGGTGPPGCLTLARWASWSAGQVAVEGGSGTERGTQGPLPKEGGLYSDNIFAGVPRVPSYATADGAGPPT